MIAAAGPLAAPAAADVIVRLGESAEEVRLGGGQILAGADVRGRRYQLRTSASSARTRTLTGMSLSALVRRAGMDPSAVTLVKVLRDNGSLMTFTPGEVISPPFPDGPALAYFDGSTTGFLRPVRASGGPNVQDHVVGEVEIIVDGTRDLAVKAKATPRRVDVGESVTFSASVVDPPPGARLRYVWSIGGTVREGQFVSHAFDVADTSALVQVEVIGEGGGQCATTCGGTAQVTVRVGDPDEERADTGVPGAGTGDAGAGYSTGGGGGGRGGSGGGDGTGDGAGDGERDPAAGARRPRRPAPAPRRPFGVRISGVLIEDLGARVRKLPGGRPAGAVSAAPRSRAGDAGEAPVELGGLLALALFAAGALRERRGVRLRVA